MQLWYRLAVLFCCVGLLLIAFGCSDDDDDTSPTGSTTTDLDTQFTIFGSQFGGVEEGTGEMLGMLFLHIDEILTPVGRPKQHRQQLSAFSIDYHSDSKFWVITDTLLDEDTIAVMDSIQFIEDTDTVQWPVDSLLTEIRSFMKIEFLSDNITTGELTQNVVLTGTATQSDTVFVNGTGTGVGDLVDSIHEGPDSTVCDVYIDGSWTLTDITIDASQEIGGPPCPFDGEVVYTVSVDIGCSGAMNGSTNGVWTVTLQFLPTQMNYLYEFGGASWPRTGSCGN